MYLDRHTSAALSLLIPRDGAAKEAAQEGNGNNSTQPPALSPSAIVGIAIVGAMFFCVAAAAILRYFQPPQNENEASLFRPESDSQLEHMKQVREFNRAAAAERAEEARAQVAKEREQKMMARVLRGEKMRRGSAVSVVKEKEEWRKKMNISAMEAGGALAVDEGEGWPLIGAKSRETAIQRRETLIGGPRDYSDGAYDTGSGSGGGSNGSAGDFEVMDLKGKQPERGGDQLLAEETKRLTSPAGPCPRTPQPSQQQQTVSSVPDYYE